MLNAKQVSRNWIIVGKAGYQIVLSFMKTMFLDRRFSELKLSETRFLDTSWFERMQVVALRKLGF